MVDSEILALITRRMETCPEFRDCLQAAADRQRRVETAARLLNSGIPRNQAQAILRERFGISRAMAYLILEQALEIRIRLEASVSFEFFEVSPC